MLEIDPRSFLAGSAAGVGLCAFALLAFWVVSPWVRALLSGGAVPIFGVLGMRLRGSPVNLLIDAHLSLLHGGAKVGIADVESKYLAHRAQIVTSQDLVDLILADRPPTPTPCPE